MKQISWSILFMWSLLSILFIKKVNGTDSGCTNDDSESDSYGHTCSGWYDANPVDCGVLFDTDNFIANEACCACGGGIALSQLVPIKTGEVIEICVRTLPKNKYYFSLQPYFANSDDSDYQVYNCQSENDDGEGNPQSYPSYVSNNGISVVLGVSSAITLPTTVDQFTYYFSCEDADFPGTRVSNNLMLKLSNPLEKSQTIQLINSNLNQIQQIYLIDGSNPNIEFTDLYNNIYKNSQSCGYSFILTDQNSDAVTLEATDDYSNIFSSQFDYTLFQVNNENTISSPVATLINGFENVRGVYTTYLYAKSDTASNHVKFVGEIVLTTCEVRRNDLFTEDDQIAFSWIAPDVYNRYLFFKFFPFQCEYGENDDSFDFDNYIVTSDPDGSDELSTLEVVDSETGIYINPTDTIVVAQYVFYISVSSQISSELSIRNIDSFTPHGPFSLTVKDCSGQMQRQEPSGAFQDVCIRQWPHKSFSEQLSYKTDEYYYLDPDYPSTSYLEYGDCEPSDEDENGYPINQPTWIYLNQDQNDLNPGVVDFNGQSSTSTYQRQMIFIEIPINHTGNEFCFEQIPGGDIAGNNCDWYGDRTDQCGNYDTESFQAMFCCVCQTTIEFPFEHKFYYKCKDLNCPSSSPVLQWKSIIIKQPSQYIDQAQGLTLGDHSDQESTQNWKLTEGNDDIPNFNFTSFARSVMDESTPCGFSFRIGSSQDLNSDWPSKIANWNFNNQINVNNQPSWASSLELTENDNAYVMVKTAQQNKIGVYQFYIIAVSDVSDDYWVASDLFTLVVYIECTDAEIQNTIQVQNQNAAAGIDKTFYKLRKFNCETTSMLLNQENNDQCLDVYKADDASQDRCDSYNEGDLNCQNFEESSDFNALESCCTCGGGTYSQYEFKYQVVNSFSDGLVLTAIYYSNESYVRIVPDDPNLIRSYTFMIEVENHEPYLTSTFGPYTLNVTCDNNFILSDMILAINGSSQTQFLFNQNSFTSVVGIQELKFNEFNSSLPPCVPDRYSLSHSNTTLDNFEDLAIIFSTLDSGFTIQFDTRAIRNFTFFVFADNSFGNQAFSERIDVQILEQVNQEPQQQEPVFERDVPDQSFEADMTKDINTFLIQLPPANYENEDYKSFLIYSEMFGTIDSASINKQSTEFMSYNQTSRVIKISIPQQFLSTIIGDSVQFDIILKDDKGERSKYTPTYEFIDPTVIPTFIPSWESFEESELELEEEIHDLQIKDIERSGLVCLEPSDLLVIPIESVDEINDRLASIFNISIDIGSELTENELKFEAQMTSFSSSLICIQLEFEQPLNVSKNQDPDFLMIEVLEGAQCLFISESSQNCLGEDQRFLSPKRLPAQLPSGISKEFIKKVVDSGGDTIFAFIICTMIIQLMLKKVTKKGLTAALLLRVQLITYIKFYDFQFSAVLEVTMEKLWETFEYKQLSASYLIEFFKLQDDIERVFNITKENQDKYLPYFNPYVMFLILFVVNILVLGLLLLIPCLKNIVKSKIEAQIVELKWNGILMAISFSYLSMVLTFYRKISEFRSGNPQWYDVWILLGGGFILALYPFMILTIFQENKTSEFKHSKKLQQKFESSIYQDVIMNEVIRPKNKFHYLKFWLFRVSFILIPIVAKGKPCIQWILLQISTLLYACYQLGTKPHHRETQLLNCFQFSFAILYQISLIFSTDYILNAQTKFSSSLITTGLILLAIAVNLLYLISKTVFSFFQLREWKTKAKQKLALRDQMKEMFQDQEIRMKRNILNKLYQYKILSRMGKDIKRRITNANRIGGFKTLGQINSERRIAQQREQKAKLQQRKLIQKIVNDTVQHQEHIKAQEKIKAQHKKKSQINGKSKSKKIKFDAKKFGAPSHIQLEIISEKEDEQELESQRINKPIFESKDILQDIQMYQIQSDQKVMNTQSQSVVQEIEELVKDPQLVEPEPKILKYDDSDDDEDVSVKIERLNNFKPANPENPCLQDKVYMTYLKHEIMGKPYDWNGEISQLYAEDKKQRMKLKEQEQSLNDKVDQKIPQKLSNVDRIQPEKYLRWTENKYEVSDSEEEKVEENIEFESQRAEQIQPLKHLPWGELKYEVSDSDEEWGHVVQQFN